MSELILNEINRMNKLMGLKSKPLLLEIVTTTGQQLVRNIIARQTRQSVMRAAAGQIAQTQVGNIMTRYGVTQPTQSMATAASTMSEADLSAIWSTISIDRPLWQEIQVQIPQMSDANIQSRAQTLAARIIGSPNATTLYNRTVTAIRNQQVLNTISPDPFHLKIDQYYNVQEIIALNQSIRTSSPSVWERINRQQAGATTAVQRATVNAPDQRTQITPGFWSGRGSFINNRIKQIVNVRLQTIRQWNIGRDAIAQEAIDMIANQLDLIAQGAEGADLMGFYNKMDAKLIALSPNDTMVNLDTLYDEIELVLINAVDETGAPMFSADQVQELILTLKTRGMWAKDTTLPGDFKTDFGILLDEFVNWAPFKELMSGQFKRVFIRLGNLTLNGFMRRASEWQAFINRHGPVKGSIYSLLYMHAVGNFLLPGLWALIIGSYITLKKWWGDKTENKVYWHKEVWNIWSSSIARSYMQEETRGGFDNFLGGDDHWLDNTIEVIQTVIPVHCQADNIAEAVVSGNYEGWLKQFWDNSLVKEAIDENVERVKKIKASLEEWKKNTSKEWRSSEVGFRIFCAKEPLHFISHNSPPPIGLAKDLDEDYNPIGEDRRYVFVDSADDGKGSWKAEGTLPKDDENEDENVVVPEPPIGDDNEQIKSDSLAMVKKQTESSTQAEFEKFAGTNFEKFCPISQIGYFKGGEAYWYYVEIKNGVQIKAQWERCPSNDNNQDTCF